MALLYDKFYLFHDYPVWYVASCIVAVLGLVALGKIIFVTSNQE